MQRLIGGVILAVGILAAASGALASPEKVNAAISKGDYETAFRELSADAKAGDPDAMYLLSQLYAEGKGVKQDIKASFQWMEKAAQAGNVPGQGSLGMFYSEGIGTEKNDAKSLEWGRRAAEGGHLVSQFVMGVRYDTGTGVTRDLEQAIAWWTKAAERGFLRAQVMLGEALARRAAAADARPDQASADRVEAAKWLIVADSTRLPGVEKLLPALLEKMTPEEIEAAKEKVRAVRPNTPGN